MNVKLKHIAKLLVARFPSSNLSRFCEAYVSLYKGDGCDMEVNGEKHVAAEILPKCGVIFDVGANVGEWTQLAKRVNPKAEVHCFEPSAVTYGALERNLAGIEGIELNNFGLGGRKERRLLYLLNGKQEEESGRPSGVSSVYCREHLGGNPGHEEQIDLSTVDIYCEERNIRNIDFLKIDVEGHELEVLRGAGRMLEAGCIDTIQFEYNNTWQDARIFLKDCWEYVLGANKNYRFYKIHPFGDRPMLSYHQSMETFGCSNWLLRLG